MSTKVSDIIREYSQKGYVFAIQRQNNDLAELTATELEVLLASMPRVGMAPYCKHAWLSGYYAATMLKGIDFH